jgi:spore germination protein YaaH
MLPPDPCQFVLNIHVSYRHLYNLFVEEAARRFRHRGLKFSVAVVAKHSDQPEGYVESFWKNWAGRLTFFPS